MIASSPPVSEPKAGRISLVAVATKQRRETGGPMLNAKLGVEMAGISGAGSSADGLVAKDHPVDLGLLNDPAAAMVDEAGVVVADDPGPVEP